MISTPILVFDIETIPDIQTGKRLYPELADLGDDDALTALIALRHAESGTEFMRLPLHKIACLSFLWFDGTTFHLKSLTLQTMSEKEILVNFLRAFDKKPVLVSWNGLAFDLPVLMHRSMHHQLSAPALFGSAQKFGYSYRYGEMHIDLMDKTALHNNKLHQKLDTVASLCGFAGKGNLDGSQVLPMVQNSQWDALSCYCESDVLNTWLIYLRWLTLTGKSSTDECQALIDKTNQFVQSLTNSAGKLHHQSFLDAWVR